jgi:hypothetical protein
VPVPAELDPEALLAVLERHGVRFVVIGAFAAVVHGWSGATEDIDITPAREVRNLARLVDALHELGAAVACRMERSIRTRPFDDQRLRMRDCWLFATKHSDLDVVINHPAGFAGYATLVPESSLEAVGEHEVAVASLDAVIASKEALGRDKDRAVLPLLRRLRDEQRAEEAP